MKKFLKISLRLGMFILGCNLGFGVVEASGVTYYLDSINGDDNNSGLSEQKPWQSLEKVNSTIFNPGDKILFKSGCEWTGKLSPKGSGEEGNPIVIDKYGDGEKPVLKPGPDWVDPYMTMNDRVIRNVKVNSVIVLSNQEYFEINNLELYDPNFDNVNQYSTDVYRRGIYIRAQDVGKLEHIYIKDMYIHGFRGSQTNDGKVAGGIIFHTTFDADDISARKQTWFEDIQISECHIEKVGRTGIKFHSCWCTRMPDGDRFPNVDFKGIGEWKPNVKIHIFNNEINDIDGDAILIRDCKDIVVEYNTVYRAAAGSGFAAGIFNWNSDNTLIQFNEVYDTQQTGDAQGIEIDALNQNTIVQYNYVHDNAGGFMMWCNTNTLPSYDGIYRYNISENDGTSHGLIDWRPNHHGSMAYNNVIYLGENESREFIHYFGNSSYDDELKFYNNIIYNEGSFSATNYYENIIDFDSNIFYGTTSIPQSDKNIITKDPKFKNPGNGGFGIDTLDGYKLKEDSPAINTGRFIGNDLDVGIRDYFNNPLYNGRPDIGANEFSLIKYPDANPYRGGRRWK